MSDVICAISTAHGMGAIAVIRLSGDGSVGLVDKLFVSANGKRCVVSGQKANTVRYGIIEDLNGEAVDEVVVTVFRAPHSYTGEDSVEVACHGSRYIQQRLLQLFIDAGARLAAPGEFSRRAFVNGKMDLSQTEAVADLISAESEQARRVAFTQMKGGFESKLSVLRQKLVDFTALLELELDFSDQEVEFADRTQLMMLLAETSSLVQHLASTFKMGNAIKNGIPIAIVGPTNAGKSTLLNTLLGEDRAIVSDIHGTTRDTIEELLTIDGVQFRLIDTAGLRKTDDVIEQVGIEKSIEKVDRAQIVLLLLDSSMSSSQVDSVALLLSSHLLNNQRVVVALNKADVCKEPVVLSVDTLQLLHNPPCISISAKEEQGIDGLKQLLIEQSGMNQVSTEDVIVTNVRHYQALMQAYEALQLVRNGVEQGISGELVALDVHTALDALAQITGQVTSTDVLHNIFAKFCIGK